MNSKFNFGAIWYMIYFHRIFPEMQQQKKSFHFTKLDFFDSKKCLNSEENLELEKFF